jgi:hypothetical protein
MGRCTGWSPHVTNRASCTALIAVLCWNSCIAQDSIKVDIHKTILIATNIPIGMECIYLLSSLRKQEVPLTSPHWRADSLGCDSQRFDIAGNALYCYVLTRTLRHAYASAGFSAVPATIISGVNVALLHAYLKYRESVFWGAERHDFYGAWAGISFAILQSAYPSLERVQYKWFWNNTVTGDVANPFLENYGAQRFFLSVRLGDFLFENKFLQGFGFCFGGGLHGDGTVRNYFGLDYDIRVLLPGFLGEMLNYIHIPLPAVYYDNGLRFGFSL